MMTRRERLMSSLLGKPVDRPPVNFYEINGFDENPADASPYNIYAHPSWKPLLDLTRTRTDTIVMRNVGIRNAQPHAHAPFTTVVTEETPTCRLVTRTVRACGRVLTERTREDRDVRTVWTLEHLLKDADDLRAWLSLPPPVFSGEPDTQRVLETEAALGDAGIVMIDTADPICCAAQLFEMGTYTIMATTEPELFQETLARFAAVLQPRTEAIARALPGRLWRIYGPEYASVPYLSPRLFHDYVVRHDKPMVEAIQRHGGYARLHCHGNLKAILDNMVSTGCSALDPLEPPPQGDITLAEVRRRYGRNLTLFGNLEISDIESLTTAEMEQKVHTAIGEGTGGEGRGFVLMPTACPYGRVLPDQTLRNYEAIVRIVESL